MKKAQSVIYCDPKGLEHEALVVAVNPFNPKYISLVYVDESKSESDNVVKLLDVQHMSALSEYRIVKDSHGNDVEEGNKDLPTYHLNCWKEYFADSKPLPPDHPAYDHPHQKTHDEQGQRIPVARPAYDADIEAHQASKPRPTIAELEEILNSEEKQNVVINPDGSVTAVPAAPGAQQIAISSGNITFDAKAGTATSGLPSAADLDATAAEQKAKEDTGE
jgi:hypothetical protein